MGILENLNNELKNAIKTKDSLKLDSLRAIKSAVLMAQTAKNYNGSLEDDEIIKLLQRLVKQRRESAKIYKEQNRHDLAEPEELQAEIISSYLPEQLSETELLKVVRETISEIDAVGIKDMGKTIGMVNKKVSGKAEGKLIASLVKKELSE
ncbi:MAG: glutamyl-tRNA amidotransferase [Flavobacteriaceae bacterium TMED68]|nr:MAG: glutamyl-tRNA amidotransferase [Flavobacteriaceae bacterium TMED68]|tara:strand:+ start:10079 stop:10531 length:453 start_codon:yes stop_codon:yes gene_type:complete